MKQQLLKNDDLSKNSAWTKNWLVTFSATKTKSLIVSNKKDADKSLL